jgi:hypothetical protein
VGRDGRKGRKEKKGEQEGEQEKEEERHGAVQQSAVQQKLRNWIVKVINLY